jgi:hypothetical protein
MGHPGKRAPTVEECDSDTPFEPLAQREHALGPYPIDPNLISQGVPPDSRVDANDRLYAPTEGTPRPPVEGATSGPEPTPPPPQETVPPDPPVVAPQRYPGHSGFDRDAPVAFARYDPGTGKYMAPDGRVYEQRDLVATASPHTWEDILLPE